MSDVAVQLDWPTRDVDALFRAMDAAVKYLGHDHERALRAGMRSVLRSLGTSTKVAPQYRDILESLSPSYRVGLKKYYVTGWLGSPRKLETREVHASSMANVKRYHARIGRRGLARNTWKFAARKATGSSSGVSAPSNAAIQGLANGLTSSKQNFRGTDMFIEATNRATYIESAMQGGPQQVSTAMARAASGLMQSVEKQLVKRMGLN